MQLVCDVTMLQWMRESLQEFLIVAWKTCESCNVFLKLLSPTAVILVRDSIHISNLNNI